MTEEQTHFMDHYRYRIIELEDILDQYKIVGAQIIHSDARGQGVNFSHAMNTLKNLLLEHGAIEPNTF